MIRNFLFDLVGISWWKERLVEWKAHVQYMRDNGNMTLYDRQVCISRLSENHQSLQRNKDQLRKPIVGDNILCITGSLD